MYVCRIHARTHALPHLILFIHSVAINRSTTDSHRPLVLLGLESRVSGRGFDLGLSLNSNSKSSFSFSFNLSSSLVKVPVPALVHSFVRGRLKAKVYRPTDEVISHSHSQSLFIPSSHFALRMSSCFSTHETFHDLRSLRHPLLLTLFLLVPL